MCTPPRPRATLSASIPVCQRLKFKTRQLKSSDLARRTLSPEPCRKQTRAIQKDCDSDGKFLPKNNTQ